MLAFHNALYIGLQGIVVGLQSAVNLQLSGVAILVIAVAIGAWLGWNRGLRAILTIALISVLAYVICVQGGDLLVATVNRFYQNGPKLAAFAAGRDPSSVAPLPPLIEGGFRIPLVFRFVLFISLIVFAWFFRKTPSWYRPNVDKLEPLARPLGAIVGGFTALVWTSAATAFWVEFVNSGGGFDGLLGDVLFAIPDITPYMPALITVFFLLLGVLVVFLLPRLFRTPAPPPKS
ncbi:MAG: hypothetical protein H7Y32_16235 [Chloroflexales bacterium]|nr:hypothetical protein [Chloroflexales bacterium]